MSPFLKIVLRPPFDGRKIHGSLFCLVSFWDTERSSWNWPEYQDAEGAGRGEEGWSGGGECGCALGCTSVIKCCWRKINLPVAHITQKLL